MQQLHPRAIWLFFLRHVLRWLVIIILLPAGVLAGVEHFLVWLALAILVLLVLIYLWSRLEYRFYRYQLGDQGFQKDCGVIRKKHVTIPYDRVQNVDIHRGILARMLGLADIHVETAGRGGALAEGRLPGLGAEAAQKFRDDLMGRMQQVKSRGQGL